MTFAPSGGFNNLLSETFQYPLNSADFESFYTRREKLTAQILNTRIRGHFELSEIVDGEIWFVVSDNNNKRSGFRKSFDRPAGIGVGGTDAFLHTITNMVTPTRIWGVATTATPDWRPIPYTDATAVTDQIEITVTATQIIVVNGATAPVINSYIVILEYLKQ